jgi:hypothetical protein
MTKMKVGKAVWFSHRETEEVKDMPQKSKKSKKVPRSTKWQRENREAYNAYMREYMRKRRAEGKA